MPGTSGEQSRDLAEVMTGAFDRGELRILLSDLGRDLDTIVNAHQPFGRVVLEVVGKAVMEGWLRELVREAAEARPNNSQLLSLLGQLGADTVSGSGWPGTLTAAQTQELIEAIVDAFDLGELRELVWNYLDMPLEAEVNVQAPFREVVSRWVHEVTLGRVAMEDFIHAIATERPHNPRVRDMLEHLGRAEASGGESDKPVVLTGEQSRDLVETMADAFDLGELRRLTQYHLDLRLEDAVNVQAPFRVIVGELVNYLRRRGRTGELLQALVAERAENNRVRAVLERLGVVAETSSQEKVVRDATPFIDIKSFRTRLTEYERRVCRVEVGDEGGTRRHGTGFLVGHDKVMVCYHMIDHLARNPDGTDGAVKFRFDYRVARDAVVNEGTVFSVRQSDWLLAWSPTNELDYAIIRLDRDVEPERGFIRLPATPPPVAPGMAVFILQHPEAKPLQLAIEMNGVIRVSSDGRFIHHRAATEPGSGGSPVFNADWDLIGLHHAARAGLFGRVNEAVAMAAIVEDLLRNSVLLGDSGVVVGVPGGEGVGPHSRDLRPIAEPEQADESPALSDYRKAAAVLQSFDIGKLKPLPPAEADEGAAIQLMTECSFRSDPVRGPRYSLNPDVRRATLAGMTLDEIRDALRLNRELPEELPQRLFSALVLGEPLPAVTGDVQRLRDLLQAVTWLKGKIDSLPDETLLRQRVAREELLAPHRHLAGRNFQGRAYELFRLGALLEGEGETPLLLYGIGGSGKSALIARFLLDRHQGVGAWAPFVFFDFDRPELVAEEPITLLAEAVRQLGAQHPELTGEAAACLARWEARLDEARSLQPTARPKTTQPTLARYTVDEDARRDIRAEFLGFLRRILLPGDRLLLVLDTFEEVQSRSRDAVDRFWDFITELRAEVPGLRVVVSGRAEWEDRPVEQLALGDLDPDPARQVVVAEGTPATVAAKVVELVGGNPLCLRLAVQVLHRDGLEAFDGLAADDLSVSGAIRSQLIQGLLYKRILGHLHDEEVEKLAFPGLTVRRIDPGVIREVLAVPCGLNVPDDATADDLFTRLSREIALVQPGRAGALYHRSDVRRVMLGLLRTESAGQYEAINRAAAEYYRARTAGQPTPDPAARAEEIYHRLASGDPIEEIDRLWMPGVEEFLRGAVDDFTMVGPATFLAGRLGVEVPPHLWDQSRLEDWERRAAKRADDLVRLGDPAKALEVVTGRPERSPASPLYEIEARLRLDMGDPVSAILVARAGIESSLAAANESVQLDLMLVLADALWIHGERLAARSTCGGAIAVAGRLLDPIRTIDALTRLLRFGRALDVHAEDDTPFRTRLSERLRALPRSGLHSHVLLAQQAAVEALPEDPEVLRYVEDTVGVIPELTQDQINLIWDHLLRWVESSPEARDVIGSAHPAFGEVQRVPEQLARDVLAKLENDPKSSTTELLRLVIGTPLLTTPDFVVLLQKLLERPLPKASVVHEQKTRRSSNNQA